MAGDQYAPGIIIGRQRNNHLKIKISASYAARVMGLP